MVRRAEGVRASLWPLGRISWLPSWRKKRAKRKKKVDGKFTVQFSRPPLLTDTGGKTRYGARSSATCGMGAYDVSLNEHRMVSSCVLYAAHLSLLINTF